VPSHDDFDWFLVSISAEAADAGKAGIGGDWSSRFLQIGVL
jgi:hypothetical protein